MAKDPIQTLTSLENRLARRVAGVLNKHAARIKMKLRNDKPLQERSGRRFPYLTKPARSEDGHLVARVLTPVSWGKVHIGPQGTAVTITPKRGRFLGLPTDFVRKVRGKAVGARRYGAGKEIFGGVIWGKAGWGGAKTGGGLRQRRAAGEKFKKKDLVPLFILEGSVVVRRRIHPEVLIQWVRSGFLADLKKVVSLNG